MLMKLAALLFVLALAAPALAQQPPATVQGQSTVQIDSSGIVGSPVRSADGKDLGKVSKLMIDPREGRVTTVIVTMGGKLGMGGRDVSVPWSSVKIGQDQKEIVVTIDQQLLDQAPAASPATDDKGDKKK